MQPLFPSCEAFLLIPNEVVVHDDMDMGFLYKMGRESQLNKWEYIEIKKIKITSIRGSYNL